MPRPKHVIQPRPYDQIYKVLVLGDSGVGKTALMERFAFGSFERPYRTTIDIGFRSRNVDFNGFAVRFQIWDTVGQERFLQYISPGYFRNAKCALLAYDITSQESLSNVCQWHAQVVNRVSSDTAMTLVGTKSDLEDQRTVSREEAETLAEALGIPHFETSSKDDMDVSEAFMSLLNRVEPFATEIYPWKWTTHTKMPKSAQTTVLTVLLCAARLSIPQPVGNSIACHSEFALLNRLRRWALGASTTESKSKTPASLPHLPWEMWFAILACLRVGDLKYTPKPSIYSAAPTKSTWAMW
eukprot:m.463661 g.463661  ORF g.463661 m.463661 type:complete len:298 (+) comp23129_c0_seq1:148-1041(+)